MGGELGSMLSAPEGEEWPKAEVGCSAVFTPPLPLPLNGRGVGEHALRTLSPDVLGAEILKNPLQKMCRKTGRLAMRRVSETNAARDVGQRRTRRLQFPRVEMPNPAGGIWRKSTRNLSTQPSPIVLSLPLSSKCLFANH